MIEKRLKKLGISNKELDEEFAAFCDLLNRREEMKFDLEKDDFEKIRGRFEKFF